MTLVTIDLGDVAGGHDPDDHVVIRAEAFRESQGGGITSTAEVVIPLVDGVGQAEVEPGPVVVSFRCRAVADTREKRGVVPESGPVVVEDVIAGAFEYTPAVVNRGLDLIEGARDEALGQVSNKVDAKVAASVDNITWRKGYTALGDQNLNSVLTQGLWSQFDTTMVTPERNYPADTGRMVLEVILLGGGSGAAMQNARFLTSGQVWTRALQSGAWSLWRRVDGIPTVNTIPHGADWNELRTAGTYRRGSSVSDLNAPNTSAGVLIVTDATGVSSHVAQLWQAHDGQGIYWRSRGQKIGGAWEWSPWARLDKPPAPTPAPGATDSYGPAVSYGDSITWAGGYQPIVQSLVGLESYANRGVSGRPMADGTANGSGTATTILANADHATYDLATIAAGTNDFKLNVPLGSIGTLADTAFDRTTFYGAYRTALDYLLQQAPDLRIVLMTPLKRNNSGYTDESTNTAGHMLRDYRTAIIALGELYSLPVIDLYATSGFNKWTLPTWTSDGLHPNATGYPFMARAISGQLKTVMALEAI